MIPLQAPLLTSYRPRSGAEEEEEPHTETHLLMWIMKTMFPITKQYYRYKCIRERERVGRNVKIH